MANILHSDLTFEIIGTAMEVHRVLGPGFLESVYQHEAQILSYLKASGLAVGLLINFAKSSLEHRRIILRDAFRGDPASV